MLAAACVVVAAALQWHSATGGPVVYTATTTEFPCRGEASRFDVEADYRTWRSVSVRVANSTFVGQCTCIVNVTHGSSSERRQPELSPLLLLVKVEHLRLNSPENSFYASMSNPLQWKDNYSDATYCDPTYLWASQSLELYLYIANSAKALASYNAAFIVTEATNVCGLASRSGELVVESSGSTEYAFAPYSIQTLLPPSNVMCAPEMNYSLAIRPSVASAYLNVFVLACPSNKSCATLLLNGRSCSDGEMVVLAPTGSHVTLNYVLRRCDGYHKLAGFVVSAQGYMSAEPQSTSAAGSSRSKPTSTATRATTRSTARITHKSSAFVRTSFASTSSSSAAIGATSARTGARAALATSSLRPSSITAHSLTGAAITSSSADATADRELIERDATNEFTTTVVAASVSAVAAAALAIGVVTALVCRRRHRLRSPGRKPPEREGFQAQSMTSTSGEEIAMLDNDLYGVTLASPTTAYQ